MKIYNFKDVLKGDSFIRRSMSIKIANVAVDLTWVIIKIQFRAKEKNGTLAKEITTGAGITITNAGLGMFDIDDFIVDFPVSIYYYDAEFTFLDGTVKTFFGGALKVNQDVTTAI